ncbi:hypothetical protein QBC40DRAFT_301851 [Triangularia verruculosa]|uniref:Uncharacterized protein n=1 Tax=Triangularia verruculosa TaxID=2587418 RepID=A0AAN7AQG2_9PEZI|nr:hypothetical protein QBC40DRAFT_301851 [Triangularia verruculosa]
MSNLRDPNKPRSGGPNGGLPIRNKRQRDESVAPFARKNQDSRDRALDRAPFEVDTMPTTESRQYFDVSTSDHELTDEEKVFYNRPDVQVLKEYVLKSEVWTEEKVRKPWATYHMESMYDDVNYIVPTGGNSYKAKIGIGVEHCHALMASIHKAACKLPRGSMAKVTIDFVTLEQAQKERQYAINSGHLVPACAACRDKRHTAEECIMACPVSGLSMVGCGLCLSQDHIMDQCKKMQTTTWGLRKIKEALMRRNVPQYQSGWFSFLDFVFEYYGLLGKSTTEIDTILLDAEKLHKEIAGTDDPLAIFAQAPCTPWGPEFAKKIQAITNPLDPLLKGKKHPSQWHASKNSAFDLPRDTSWPGNGSSGVPLVKELLQATVSDGSRNYNSAFLRRRPVPIYWKNKVLRARSKEEIQQVEDMLLENFLEIARDIMMHRQVTLYTVHPKETELDEDGSKVFRHYLVQGDMVTFIKNCAKPSKIELLSFGKLEDVLEDKDGAKVLVRRQRNPKQVFAFSKPVVTYWVNKFLNDLGTPPYLLCGATYKEALPIETVVKTLMFPAVLEMWRKQEEPDANKGTSLGLTSQMVADVVKNRMTT